MDSLQRAIECTWVALLLVNMIWTVAAVRHLSKREV